VEIGHKLTDYSLLQAAVDSMF